MADDSLYYSGLDPLANTFDLGSDPLLYAERQLKLGRELWQLTESRPLPAGDDYTLLRRNFNRGLFEIQQSALQAVKYIGGLTLLSDHAGSGRTPLEPVAAAKQRAALNLLAETIFAADNFRFQPSFLSKLAISDREIDDAKRLGRSVPTRRRRRRPAGARGATRRSRSAARADVAQRLLNNELKVSAPNARCGSPSFMRDAARDAIFSELKTGQISAHSPQSAARVCIARRGRDRASDADMPADARALLRADAVQLRDEMTALQKRPRLHRNARILPIACPALTRR
jgi:hypothetical protein